MPGFDAWYFMTASDYGLRTKTQQPAMRAANLRSAGVGFSLEDSGQETPRDGATISGTRIRWVRPHWRASHRLPSLVPPGLVPPNASGEENAIFCRWITID